jgi:predicted transposase YdaD
MKTGIELWVEDVRNDGQHEKALEIAAGMKAEGMDVYTISRLTELTVDEILRR